MVRRARASRTLSKVETWEAATSLRSLRLRTANQFSGWASLALHSTALRLMSSSRRAHRDRQRGPFKFPAGRLQQRARLPRPGTGISSHLPPTIFILSGDDGYLPLFRPSQHQPLIACRKLVPRQDQEAIPNLRGLKEVIDV